MTAIPLLAPRMDSCVAMKSSGAAARRNGRIGTAIGLVSVLVLTLAFASATEPLEAAEQKCASMSGTTPWYTGHQEFEEGHFRVAEVCFARSIETLPMARPRSWEVSPFHEMLVDAEQFLGLSRWHLGDVEGASEAWRDAVTRSNAFFSGSDSYPSQGVADWLSREYSRAFVEYRQIVTANNSIAINPSYSDSGAAADALAGLDAGAAGDYASSLADFEKAIRVAPSMQIAHYFRGLYYLKVGNVAAAQSEWILDLEAHPPRGIEQMLTNSGFEAYDAMWLLAHTKTPEFKG